MESQNRKYSLEEKERLAVLVEKYKKEYDKEVEEKAKGPKVWDRRRKMFVTPGMTWGYLAKAVKTAHPSMSHLTEKDERFKSALMVARRAYETRKRKAGDGGDTQSSQKCFSCCTRQSRPLKFSAED